MTDRYYLINKAELQIVAGPFSEQSLAEKAKDMLKVSVRGCELIISREPLYVDIEDSDPLGSPPLSS